MTTRRAWLQRVACSQSQFNAVSRTVLLSEMRSDFSGDPALPRATAGGDPSQYGNGFEYNGGSVDAVYSGLMDNVPESVFTTRPFQYPSRTGHHLEGANFLAADGHVKWLRTEKVSAGHNAPTPDTAQVAGNNYDATAEGSGIGTHGLTMNVN